MRRDPFPPLAVALEFVASITRGDVDSLSRLMADDYVLQVFDEAPQAGRQTGTEGWAGYLSSFPDYVIYPHRMACEGGRVAILGHTTGSHLALADNVESEMTLIWLAEVRDGKIHRWQLVPDTRENRERFEL